jgi:predicted RNA-binding Zn-ribbon protein involved in translation (DUF1610 family)
MDFVDVKYINMLSLRLLKFKRVKNNLYNFRCPICGDSHKNKNRARGYLYQVKNNTNYKCHNCGVNISFSNFLKEVDDNLHKEYTFEKFKEGKTGKNFVVKEPEFKFEKPTFSKKVKLNLPKASEDVTTKKYLESRKLDPEKFYFADKFKEWVNTLKPTFDNTKYDEPRIVIPLYGFDGNLIGIQGRALISNSVKYITIMLDEEAPKIYGLESINTKLPVYVVEGPFDSTFINNCVALCGSDGDVRCLEGSDIIFIYDNEPRNKEIVRRIGDTIDRGYKVVIWPLTIQEKDVNDMILSGLDAKTVIESNIYSGLKAKLKFTTWKKI